MTSKRARFSLRRFSTLLVMMRPYRWHLVLILFLLGAAALTSQLPPLLSAWIIDRAIVPHNIRLLCIFVAVMILSGIVTAVLGVWQGYVNTVIGERFVRDLRDEMVRKLYSMPLRFFSANNTGDIMNRVCGDVAMITPFVTNTFTTLLSSVFGIAFALLFMFAMDWRLALLSCVVVPLMALPLSPAGSKLFDLQRRAREQQDTLNSHLQQTVSLGGVQLIKSFVRERHEAEKFHSIGSRLMEIEISLLMTGRWFMALITAMLIIGPAMIWLAGGVLAIKNGLSVGVIVAFISFLARLYGPASTLAALQVQATSSLSIFDRILEYIEMDGAESLDGDDQELLRSTGGSIEYRNVGFEYEPGSPVLREVDVSVPGGSLVAFVGPSGAGKSTLLQLLSRFYECTSGSIVLDGMDIKQMSLPALRTQIGNITQESYFFSGTLRENLLYGRPDASDGELLAACRQAQLSDFISRLPNGLDTVIGERGHKMSGGERQRLAIARVFLKDPPVIVLDEATSALDSASERAVQEAFEALLRGRTTLAISHRLSTIMRAHAIYVINNGCVAESGTHAQLLASNGLYAALFHEQFSRPMEHDQLEAAL